jgi:diguanylate cyclase (GGDEF)-like protein
VRIERPNQPPLQMVPQPSRRRAVLASAEGRELGEPGTSVHVTISVGVATYPEAATERPEAFLAHADERLYQAKRDGRNRYRD